MSPAMPVWPVAQRPVCELPTPSSFMNLLWLLSSLRGFLLPSSGICINRCCSLYTSGLLIHRVVSVSHPCLNMEASLIPITLVLRLTGRLGWLFLLHPYMALVLVRLINSYFFISILILALYSFILREVTKRVPF